MSNKIYKNPYAGKKREAWDKLTKSFPDKLKKKLPKSDKSAYYNQRRWVNEYEYGKGQYYNEYYNDGFDLIKTDKNSDGESHNDPVSQEKTLGIFRKFINTY